MSCPNGLNSVLVGVAAVFFTQGQVQQGTFGPGDFRFRQLRSKNVLPQAFDKGPQQVFGLEKGNKLVVARIETLTTAQSKGDLVPDGHLCQYLAEMAQLRR